MFQEFVSMHRRGEGERVGEGGRGREVERAGEGKVG